MAGKPKFTKTAVRIAIEKCRGNIQAVADELGVTRQTIYNYFERYPDLKTKADSMFLDSLRAVIEPSYGNITTIANKLKVSRQTIYNYLSENPDLMTEVKAAEDGLIDIAENALVADIRNPDRYGHQSAYMYVLNTRGRKRGWGKSVDVTSGGQPLKTFVTVSPDDWDE